MTETMKVNPSLVEFRLPAGRGIRVVKVFFTGKTPRVVCYSQVGYEQIPAALFVDDILDYIKRAEGALNPKGE
jgi:hypothetical protein